jgi:hypothetical protein
MTFTTRTTADRFAYWRLPVGSDERRIARKLYHHWWITSTDKGRAYAERASREAAKRMRNRARAVPA